MRRLLFDILLFLPISGVEELVIVRLMPTEAWDISWAVMGSGVGGRPVEGLGGLLAGGEANCLGLRNMEIGDLDAN